jgi:preprotein translocase subunit SecG
VILLQQGKGGDIANAFGGGASQAVFGARAGATVLTKVTTGLTVAFMSLALLLAVWGSRGTSSVVGGVDGPAAPQLPAAATAPVTTPPAGATTPAPATTTPESAPTAAPTTPPPAPTEPPPAKKQ